MKKWFAASCLWLVIVSFAHAQKPGNISVGYIRVGTQDVYSLSWRPDFKFGPLGLGADINVPLGDARPSGYENMVLRYIEYDDLKRGLRYGALEGITWGHGLLIKNYTTRLAGPVLLNNQQMGLKGYLDFDSYVVRGIWTRTALYGVRVEQRINPMLILGEHYISHSAAAGFGVDAAVPMPLNFELYADAAQLVNHGGGLEAGFSWAYDIMVGKFSFQGGWRTFDKGFIPSYFSSDFETNPPNIASAEAVGSSRNGFLAELNADALGLAQLSAIYENYTGTRPSLAANLTAKLNQETTVTGYYKQPSLTDFRSLSFDQGAILGGSVAYKVNPMATVVLHYKKAYNPATGLVESTRYYEMQFSF